MKTSLFQGVLISIFGLSALIGIFVFATHSNTGSSSSGSIGTVVIWGVLPKTDIQNVLVAIAQSDQTFKGVSYIEKEKETLSIDLATAIATDNVPDLVLASQEDLQAITRFLLPIPFTTLSPATFNSAFVREAGLFTAPNGAGYYGVPFLVDPLALYSNRSILSSGGVAKPPETWEAMTGLVPVITELSSTKQVTRALIGLGTYDNVRNARAILSTLFLQTGVPMSEYQDNQLVADLDGVATNSVSPGQAVVNFYTQFADPAKLSYTWDASFRDSRQSFLAGDTALYLGFISEARALRAGNPNLDFMVSPVPQPGTAKTKSTYGLVYAFLMPRGSRNPSGAYQAAALLTNSTAQQAAATATGLAPAALGELAQAPADPVAAVAYAEALYTDGWLSPSPASVDRIFSSMITSVITGRADSGTAITASQAALTALLQK